MRLLHRILSCGGVGVVMALAAFAQASPDIRVDVNLVRVAHHGEGSVGESRGISSQGGFHGSRQRRSAGNFRFRAPHRTAAFDCAADRYQRLDGEGSEIRSRFDHAASCTRCSAKGIRKDTRGALQLQLRSDRSRTISRITLLPSSDRLRLLAWRRRHIALRRDLSGLQGTGGPGRAGT